MESLPSSILALFRGVISRFIYWLPFILLDISDYWEKYIRPGICHFTGKDVVMPAGTLLVGAGVGIIWSAILTYHELRKEKLKQDEELSPSIEINPTPSLQTGHTADTNRLWRTYCITIKNPSAKAIKGVGLYLTEISPRVPDLDWLPMPLHIKHDNLTPFRETFDMSPRGVRHIDIATHFEGGSVITIEHTVTGVIKTIPAGTYVLTIRAEGETITSPCEVKLLVKLDYLHRLVCLPGSYVDLDKGLFEFHDDAYAAFGPFTAALTEQTRLTNEIGKVAIRISENIDAAQSKPISINEQLAGVKNQRDRIRKLSPKWSKQIDRVTLELKSSVEVYTLVANKAVEDLTGYVELATTVSMTDLKQFTELRDAVLGAVEGLKGFRSKVLSNQNARMLTHLTRSMRLLGVAIDGQVETTKNIAEALGAIVYLAERKTASQVDTP
jgi:hypothetical protein